MAMNGTSQKRPVRARSGLRPTAERKVVPRVPGGERSKAPSKARDGRTAHDKDGNAEAQRELNPENHPTRR
jgi:hypothetical protein